MKRSSGKLCSILMYFSIVFLIVVSVSNCREKEEGCLDIEATNFSVSANTPCSNDCCTYPDMTIEIAFRWDTLSFTYNTPFNLSEDTVIKVMKSKFYISDISLTNHAETFKVLDEIELSVNDGSGTRTFTNDFALISRDFSSFNYTIGEITGAGSFDSLRFFVGLRETANKVEPTSAPENHPLSIQSDSMWSVENAYVFNKLIMNPDTALVDLDTLEFNVTDVMGDLERGVEIVLPLKYDLAVGTDMLIKLKVDYFQWFQGINFEADSVNVVDEIVKNTAKAFSINE